MKIIYSFDQNYCNIIACSLRNSEKSKIKITKFHSPKELQCMQLRKFVLFFFIVCVLMDVLVSFILSFLLPPQRCFQFMSLSSDNTFIIFIYLKLILFPTLFYHLEFPKTVNVVNNEISNSGNILYLNLVFYFIGNIYVMIKCDISYYLKDRYYFVSVLYR